jgi:hypothetical protein
MNHFLEVTPVSDGLQQPILVNVRYIFIVRRIPEGGTQLDFGEGEVGTFLDVKEDYQQLRDAIKR